MDTIILKNKVRNRFPQIIGYFEQHQFLYNLALTLIIKGKKNIVKYSQNNFIIYSGHL